MSKKVCLIVPVSTFLLDERVFPFLGILKVASAFKAQGCEVSVLDLSGLTNYLDVVEDYFKNKPEFDFIGLTATTPQMPVAYTIAAKIKQINPEYKLVLGGSHITLMHTASKNEKKNNIVNGRATLDVEIIKKYFNVLVCGDGELTLNAILELDNGIIDVDDRFSPHFLTNEKFSSLPNPARHLIDMETYQYFIEGHKATSLVAQLGCPFRCTFCSGRSSPYLRMVRNRSTQSIVEEIEFLHKEYGYTGFNFFDDELNVSKTMIQMLNEIADLQDKLGVEFRLRGFVKAELLNDKQAEAMYRAGFRWLLTGFESGDERILINIDKNATKDDNTRAVEIAKRHNLKVKALMSIGHAGESTQSVENTKQWLLDIQPEEFDCTIITTYPGSPYFDFALKNEDGSYTYTSNKTGDKLHQANIDYTKDKNYYKGIPGEYNSYVWTDYLSPQDLVKLRDDLENDVRQKLNIPFNPSRPGLQYEHSMGQGNVLPDWILRSTENFKHQELPNKKKSLAVIK